MKRTTIKKLLVGLGNPGEAYENTYHNAGQLALERCITGLSPEWKKHKKLFEYIAASGGVIVVRPLTYMNDSGKAVREALKVFNTKPADLVLFHDDSDLTIGTYKISFARNSAGHKGVQSVIGALHTNAFTRVRIGIRPVRESRRQKVAEFALKKITAADRRILKTVFSDLTPHTQTSS